MKLPFNASCNYVIVGGGSAGYLPAVRLPGDPLVSACLPAGRRGCGCSTAAAQLHPIQNPRKDLTIIYGAHVTEIPTGKNARDRCRLRRTTNAPPIMIAQRAAGPFRGTTPAAIAAE